MFVEFESFNITGITRHSICIINCAKLKEISVFANNLYFIIKIKLIIEIYILCAFL